MWTVLNFEKKNLPFLRKEFLTKLGNEVEFYIPKLKLQKYINNKLCNKESFLLGNYLLCFHKNFSNLKIINSLKYCRGVKYFLNDFLKSQKEIIEFIDKCKLNEDKEGYIKQSFFEFKNNKKFRFISGPFTNMAFNIMSENDFKIKALIGNFKTTVSKGDFLYRPV